MYEPRRVAFHEAAHAVSLHKLGGRSLYTTIKPTAEYFGKCEIRSNPTSAFGVLVMTACGPLAISRAGYDHPDPWGRHSGCEDSDANHIDRLERSMAKLPEWASKPLPEIALHEHVLSEALKFNKRNWTAISLTAEALLEYETLFEGDVNLCIQVAEEQARKEAMQKGEAKPLHEVMFQLIMNDCRWQLGGNFKTEEEEREEHARSIATKAKRKSAGRGRHRHGWLASANHRFI